MALIIYRCFTAFRRHEVFDVDISFTLIVTSGLEPLGIRKDDDGVDSDQHLKVNEQFLARQFITG